ncbi:DUF2750 domain-containing protein [Shouchella miscanthi]|uniref:DUF2750 domain-containing protein n=1 Tax=Shouchella miscanthi TaxID=2598861 RepID=UPI0011A34F63|nr:DUF2750 domain-containing protein [Shouchella miscanthi]
MNKLEIEKTMRMNSQKRYEYFIKKVSDYEEVWSLRNEQGWVTSKLDNGSTSLNFWPTKEHAELCAMKEWKKTVAVSIDLEEFIDSWLPGIDNDGVSVSIFFNNKDSITVPVKEILNDLEQELENY